MTVSQPNIRHWCKSSVSSHIGTGDCVEVEIGSGSVAVRDSKSAGGGVIDLPAAAWRTFLSDRREPRQ